MKNQLDKAIRRVMAARHAEHRRAAVLVILALLTILSVSWRLHQVGIAMTDDEYSCGYEEHVHSDACYTEVLICGYEDGASETPADSAEEDGETAPAAHSHTADCYQRVLTCTIPEHTHTLECLADITADVETPADWDEQSEGVSSFWSDAMTEIAQRQLGYTESAKNFTVDKALGETLAQAHHYTRYGDWYGNPYGSWDVMFVAFCQHYAGIPEDVIPQCASLLQLRTELENAHPEYITPGGSEATPGDIVLYTNAAGEETIGIVTAYDGANLTVVSGAVDGAVAAVTVAEADVADTIRVLDAYGVYAQTGASDGSEELSFDADAILARDGAVAYIVWQRPDPIMPAAEDDDTLTEAAEPLQYDSEGNLKLDNLLTSTAISINQGGTWEPLDNTASIKDGTQVRVEIAYKVPANAFKTDGNTATYTLPAGVYPKGDLSGDITDSTGTIIGTFTLTKNSPTVTFTFRNDTSQAFTGTFKFNTTINYAETGGDGKIHLGDKTYTIAPEYSLNTKKEHTLSEDKSKVSYTVTVNAPNGTHDQKVTITDRLAENTANGSYDMSSIKIDGKPLSEYKDAKITDNADGKGFTITGLPPLGYNQSYKLTYDVNVGAVTGADGSGTIVNTAKGTTSTLQSNEAKDTVTVKESSIAKTGTYDAATHRINWVIKVTNPGGDLASYTVTDNPMPKLDIVGDVTLKRADGTVATTITGDDFLTNGYTFPENSNASSYTFTYQTAAPDPVNGTVSATNQATLEKDNLGYTATANVSTGVGKVDIRKYPGSDTLELTDTMESEHFGKTGMELMLDSIKVYEYILKDGDWTKGNEITDSVRVEKVEETASTRKYKFVLPDEKALVLEYSYKMNPGTLASDMSVKNTAELKGEIVGNNVSVKSDNASATVDNAVLIVAKTDSATNLAITASPATFEIYHYNKTDRQWESIGTWQTTNGSFDLTFAQSPAAGSSHLVTGDLYKLVETVAPADYAQDKTPHYFIWNNDATDDDKKEAALTAATGTTVPDGVTTANVSFLGVNGDRATMAIPNKQNCLTLRKIWYGIGNDTIEAPVDEIQVQLYRYKDGKDKADAVKVGKPVTLTKADGWTKKISPLESGYHYYVEELGTDSGALIFYEVKYSESNATGVTGGGTITITNKQKPSYELPATGAAGTPPYTAAGALIMGIALMLGYLINKRSHLRGVIIRNNPSTDVDNADQPI